MANGEGSLLGTIEPPIYARYYGNQWIAEAGQAIGQEEWDRCRGEIPPLDARTPLVVALDAGISSDTFAITARLAPAGPAVGLPPFRRPQPKDLEERVQAQ